MWRVVPLEWLISYFIFGAGLCAALVWLLQGQPNYARLKGMKRVKAYATTLYSTVTIFTVVTVLAGKFLWSPLASMPWFAGRVFHDISGHWVGTLQGGAGSAPQAVEVEVEQDFFALEIRLDAASRSTDARTIAVWPERDQRARAQRVWYVYESKLRQPAPTEVPVHQGAGVLEVRAGRGGTGLDGLYWTNRNWQRNGNPAGTMKLARAGKAKKPKKAAAAGTSEHVSERVS